MRATTDFLVAKNVEIENAVNDTRTQDMGMGSRYSSSRVTGFLVTLSQ